MNDELISIILPIYNVGKYLEKCLYSIKNQSYNNIEVLMVDDGSTDRSSSICKKFSIEDKRFIHIKKENGGVSSARNYGLKKAKGNYIAYIDPDDYVHSDYIKLLYENLVKYESDISICKFESIYENFTVDLDKTIKFNAFVYSSIDGLKKMLYQNDFDVAVWGKLFKKNLFDSIFFPENEINEDTATTYKLFYKSSKIVYFDANLYFYVQHNNSIMHSNFSNKKMSLLKFSEECLNFFEKYCADVVPAAICKYVTDCFVIICKIQESDKVDKKSLAKAWNIVKKYRKYVIFDKNSRKKTKTACIISYFGYRAVYFINSLKVKLDEKNGIKKN